MRTEITQRTTAKSPIAAREQIEFPSAFVLIETVTRYVEPVRGQPASDVYEVTATYQAAGSTPDPTPRHQFALVVQAAAIVADCVDGSRSGAEIVALALALDDGALTKLLSNHGGDLAAAAHHFVSVHQ